MEWSEKKANARELLVEDVVELRRPCVVLVELC